MHNHSVEKDIPLVRVSVYVIGAWFGLAVIKIVQSLKLSNVPRFKTSAE